MQPATSTLSSSSSIDFSIFFSPSDTFPTLSFATAAILFRCCGVFLPRLLSVGVIGSGNRRDTVIYKLHAHFLLFQFSFQFSSIANYGEQFQRITISILPNNRSQFCTGYASSFYLLNLPVVRASSESVEKSHGETLVERTVERCSVSGTRNAASGYPERAFHDAYPRGRWSRQADDE